MKNLLIALVSEKPPVGRRDEKIVGAILAAEAVPICQKRQDVCVVAGIKRQGESYLPLIGDAIALHGLFLGFRQDREEERGQNADDGDNHEQFHQREAASLLSRPDLPFRGRPPPVNLLV